MAANNVPAIPDTQIFQLAIEHGASALAVVLFLTGLLIFIYFIFNVNGLDVAKLKVVRSVAFVVLILGFLSFCIDRGTAFYIQTTNPVHKVVVRRNPATATPVVFASGEKVQIEQYLAVQTSSTARVEFGENGEGAALVGPDSWITCDIAPLYYRYSHLELVGKRKEGEAAVLPSLIKGSAPLQGINAEAGL